MSETILKISIFKVGIFTTSNLQIINNFNSSKLEFKGIGKKNRRKQVIKSENKLHFKTVTLFPTRHNIKILL